MTGNRDTAPFWIDPDVAEVVFPDVELAMREPDGEITAARLTWSSPEFDRPRRVRVELDLVVDRYVGG